MPPSLSVPGRTGSRPDRKIARSIAAAEAVRRADNNRLCSVVESSDESLLLALLGGTAGMLLAIWTNELLRASFGMAYGGTRTRFDVSIDTIVLGFTLALSIGTALAFGLGPT